MSIVYTKFLVLSVSDRQAFRGVRQGRIGHDYAHSRIDIFGVFENCNTKVPHIFPTRKCVFAGKHGARGGS